VGRPAGISGETLLNQAGKGLETCEQLLLRTPMASRPPLEAADASSPGTPSHGSKDSCPHEANAPNICAYLVFGATVGPKNGATGNKYLEFD
jgi:hypothetical protein